MQLCSPKSHPLDENLFEPSTYTNRASRRCNVLCLRSRKRRELLYTVLRRGINRKRHPGLTMFRLSTIKPQRRLCINLKIHSPERDQSRLILRHIGRLKARKDAPWCGLAGRRKVGLYESVIRGKEVQLHVVAGFGVDEGGGVD